jgi:hypothetical protein
MSATEPARNPRPAPVPAPDPVPVASPVAVLEPTPQAAPAPVVARDVEPAATAVPQPRPDPVPHQWPRLPADGGLVVVGRGSRVWGTGSTAIGGSTARIGRSGPDAMDPVPRRAVPTGCGNTDAWWPELPDDTPQWTVTPRRAPRDRDRYLDDEQRGLPWNA